VAWGTTASSLWWWLIAGSVRYGCAPLPFHEESAHTILPWCTALSDRSLDGWADIAWSTGAERPRTQHYRCWAYCTRTRGLSTTVNSGPHSLHIHAFCEFQIALIHSVRRQRASATGAAAACMASQVWHYERKSYSQVPSFWHHLINGLMMECNQLMSNDYNCGSK